MDEKDMICPYEDVIEEQPLLDLEERNKASCPLWGHQCPGGREQVNICKKEGRVFGA